MHEGLVYAEVPEHFKYATGYIKWYENHLYTMFTSQFPKKYSKYANEVYDKLLKEKFHFAARIRKTHHFCIPSDVILMKMRHFIKETTDNVVSKHQPVQLEFNFTYGKS